MAMTDEEIPGLLRAVHRQETEQSRRQDEENRSSTPRLGHALLAAREGRHRWWNRALAATTVGMTCTAAALLIVLLSRPEKVRTVEIPALIAQAVFG